MAKVENNKILCASFFSGVGGIDLGFEQTGIFKTVYANDIDEYAAETYDKNFKIKADVQDIHTVDVNVLPHFDVMLAGFPCQAFSIAGHRQGFNDIKGRGVLFFELIRIIKLRHPHIIFLENVKNLLKHDNGKTFSTITGLLKENGYCFKYKVLNASEYGNVPQNRERIYIVAFDNKEECDRFEFPSPLQLKKKLHDVIDFETPQNQKYYYTEGKYKQSMYEILQKEMDDENAVYQWRRVYLRKNKSGMIPTLTANQGEGGHNVCLIKTKFGIRKMTPRECFNAQGFPNSFKLPTQLSDSKLYKQAGNSVCVSVVKRIAESIIQALDI